MGRRTVRAGGVAVPLGPQLVTPLLWNCVKEIGRLCTLNICNVLLNYLVIQHFTILLFSFFVFAKIRETHMDRRSWTKTLLFEQNIVKSLLIARVMNSIKNLQHDNATAELIMIVHITKIALFCTYKPSKNTDNHANCRPVGIFVAIGQIIYLMTKR